MCNVVSKMKNENLKYLLDCGVLEVLIGLLDIQEVRTLAVVMQSLSYLLKRSKEIDPESNEVAIRVEGHGGLSIIEKHQGHPNQIIYKLAVNILEKFFAVEDIEEMLQPDAKTESGAAAPAQGGLNIFNF